MLTYPDGKLMIQKAIEGLNIPSLERIIVTLVKEHCEKYDADTIVRQAFEDKVELCILDDFTPSQGATVSQTIKKMGVKGSFISKDSDGYVSLTVKEGENFLVGVDLRKNMEVTNVAGKSFLLLNEQNMIIDIVEKTVCSNIINIGTYGFESAQDFEKAYEAVRSAWQSDQGEIYLSHVISYLIAQGAYFSYKEALDYEDWGLISDWRKVLKARRVYFVDIDGVMFKNKGKYGRVNWNSPDEPLKNNVKILKKLAGEGAQIIFCTARPESYRIKLEGSIKALSIPYHAIIMGCHHSQRVIINDFAKSNPYPACISVNVPRDGDDLDVYIYKDY